MYEGINVQNGGITVDLASLQKTENGELILDGISSLKVFVENGASYDQTKLEILENNDDVRVSFTDANGNEIFFILKGLAQILLTNQTDNPVFEVFEGPTQLATMTTIDDLEAAAAGGAPTGSDQTANPAGAGDLDGTNSDDTAGRLNGLPGAGTFDPTAAIIGNFAPVVFDVSLEDIEVLGEEGAGDKNIITGTLTVFDEDEEDIGLHTFTPIEGSLVVTSYNEDGTENGVITVLDDDILVVLNPDGTFEISGDFNDLGLREYATVSFDYFATDIEGATSNIATVTLTVEGTNDIPVVTDVNLNGSGEDQVVQDFEDELNQNDDDSIIYDSNLYVLDGSNLTSSGYFNGIVSGDNVAYNANGVSPISFSFTEVVTFESTYMTSSWYTTQDVVFEGYLNGQLIYTSDSIEINYNGPTLIELNWDNIDQLIVYNTPTGTDVQEDNGSGSHWAMDDFTYSLGSGKKVVYETIDVDSQDTNGNEILRDDEVNNLFEGTLTVTDDDDNDTHEFFMASLEEGNYNIGTDQEPMLVNLELGNLADDSTLSIDDIDLDLTINTDGTYSLGGDFTSLAVGETATVTIEYYAVDDSGAGLGDVNNEPEESEHKTITFTITGTNDQPVVENLDLNGSNSGISDIPNQFVSSGLVGYYDMAEGSGTVIQEEILSLGGFSSKDLDDLTAQDIESLNILYIDKYSSNSEFTNNLASIHSSVYNGMTLIINDGSPYEANSILPGLTQTLVSSSYSNADVNIGPDGVELSNGTLGNLDDSSLDGGSSSIHGAFESSSLPDGAKILLTSGNGNEVVAFSYEYGSGTVIYSTMPLMAYFDPNWLYDDSSFQDFIEAAKIYINNTVEDELANDIVYETNDDDSADTNQNGVLLDEDGNNIFTGKLTVSDDDVNDTHTFHVAENGITVIDSPVDSDNNEIITLDDLDITINPDGTYSIGGDFTELAVGETVTVEVEYYALDNQGKDGTDGINETSESEHKTITFTITGTNDQPVVENINLNNLDDLQSAGSDIGHIPFEGTPNGFTISFTLNLDSAVTQNTPIIYQGEGFPPNSGYIAAPYIAISNHPVYNQSLLFQMGDSYEHFYSDFSFSAGIDYDIQMVFENGTVNLYVDGNLISHAYDSGDANFDSVPTNNETMFINDVGMTVSNLVILNANGNQINVIDNSSVLYETLDTDSADTNQNGVLLDEDGNNIFTGTLEVTDDDVNDTHQFYIAENGITVVDSPLDSDNNEIITLDDLDITINPDGTYSIGGDFTELAVGETVTVNVEYYAVDNQGKDGTDGINETSESEHKTITFTITGTNDQPVVDEVTIDVLESELASNPDNQTLTIGTDSQYALGNYVSDDDVNDTHTFARADGSTISLSINTTNATLLTAIANQDLAYIKSVLAEIVAIPEVTTALTNGIDAIPAIDVQSTIAAFMAAPDIATALAIVNSTFGTVGVTAQLDPVTGLTLSIDDAGALEAESLLNVTVNQDGSYEVTSPLFDHLSVDDSVSVSFDYVANDGTNDANGETNVSEANTVTLNIQGTNDQPVVDEVTIDVLESELASNPDNQTLTIGTDSQYALGNYVSDDDVNDTHTFARADGSTISLSINTTNATLLTAIANQDLAYIKSVLAEIVAIPEVTTALTNGIDAIPAIDVQSTIAAFMAAPDIATALAIVNSTFGTVGVTAQLDPVTGLTLSIDDAGALEAESLLNVTVNQDGSYEVTSPLFDHLSVDDSVSVSFDYVANDGTNDANGETNVSEANTVTLNIQGTNDQPVVDEVTIDVLESELASNPDNQTLTIGTDSQYALGNYVSDDDVNDTHTFARADGSTISLSINTTNATLLTAIANQDLAYIKSVLAEIVAIPEVTTALTNGIDAIPAIDVQSTIAAFMAAPDIATALAIVNSTFGTVGVTAQLDPVTGLTLSIDDAGALEAESLLNVTVNQDGSYEVTSPLFDHLSVDDSVSVSFDYVANDGTNDANGETNVSEANTVTLNIQGTNDQPVIQSISKIDGIYELNDLITDFIWEEYYYVLSQEDLFANSVISDDDVNDTHTLQLASASILFDGGIYSNNFQYTFDQNSASGPNNPISNPENSGILEVTQDFLDNYPQVNANVGDFIIYNSEFNHLSAGEKVLVTFDVVANDGTNDANGETNLSSPKTVTVEVVGTNDQPVVDNITLGDTPSTIIFEENLKDKNGNEDVLFKGKLSKVADEDINNTNPHYKIVGDVEVLSNPIGLVASDIDVSLKGENGNGWTTSRVYKVFSEKFNTLADGETVTLSFNYKASDWEGFGTTGDANNEPSHSEVKTVTITITGTNDKPVAKSFIHDGPANNGQVWENAGQQIVIDPTSDFGVDDLSSIAGYDVDVNDTLRVNSISNDAGDTVTYDGVNATAWIESNSGVAVRINADGKVEYNLNMFKTNGETVFDHLDAGDTDTDTFKFTIIDNNGAVSNEAVATINILGTNDKPVIDSNLVANLTEINEDVLDVDNTGTLVSALLGNSVSDFDDDAVEGIAVTGIDNTNGTWQYSIDGGTSWTNFDNSTSDTNATMLYDSSLVRFVPNEDYYGSADITYHAWDQNGYNLVNGSTAVDITSSYGGIKGTVSVDSATSSVTVDSVQDFIANTQGNPLVDTSKDNKAKVYEVGIDDANDDSETDTKAFRIEFGDDTPGTITFNTTQTVPNGLTSGGEAVVYDVSADGLTITAKTQTTDEVVFTLEIDNTTPQTVGSYTNTNSYTMTLFKPIDHLMNQHNGETKYLSFDYDSEDSDGDVRSGNVTLQVVDDVPTAGWSGYTQNNGQTGYVVTETTDANGFVTLSTVGTSLNFDGGADGATVTELRFANEVGDKIQTKYVSNNERYFLQSQGEDIVLERAGLDITGKANGVTVFTIVVDEVTGDYTYTQYAPIDHVEGSTSGSYQDEIVNLVLQYTVTDGDGDTATGYSTIRVEDDSPISLSQNGIAQNAVVEESTVGDTTTASLRVDYGADGFASVAFTGVVEGYMHDQLTSGGVPITYDFSIPGKVIAKAGTETVFEVILNSDGKTYDVNLIGSLDHTAPDGNPGGRDEGQSINFIFEATDKDGDTLESSLSVRIIDDVPEMIYNDSQMTNNMRIISADDSAGGAQGTDQQWNMTGKALSMAVSLGADGGTFEWDAVNSTFDVNTVNGITFDVDANGTLLIFQDQGGVQVQVAQVTMDNAETGAYTYTQNANLLHADALHPQHGQANTSAFTLAFKAIDADGDTLENEIDLLIKDDVPLSSWTAPVLADETSLNTVVNGQLNFDGGADGAEVTSVFHHWQNANDGTVKIYDGPNGTAFTLTSGGEAVVVTYEDNGMTMVGKLSDDTEVFRLEAQSDGSFTFVQKEAIDHPIGSTQEDDLLLKLKFTVTDADGDTSTSNFGVKIADDTPVADYGGRKDISEVDIDSLVPASVNGQLIFDGGEDGATLTDVNFWGEGSQVMVYDGQGNPPIALTSNGEPVIATQMVDVNGVITITALANTTPVYTLVVQPDGNYEFTLEGPIDHPQSSLTGQDEELLLRYSYTVTDGDGDTDVDYFSINIIDDVPTIDGMSSASTTEADANNDGIFDEAVVTGTLGRINEGADEAIVTEMHISNTADYNNLTSGGDAVTATQVGNVITGAKADGTVVFTFTYNENGDYIFTQKEPLDHNGRSETLIKLGFGYTITDADGDAASSALIVSIHDDEPIVVADTNSVNEAASGITTKSQISGNILTNDKDVDIDNDDAIQIIGLEMTSPQVISSTVATHTINGQLYEGFHISGVYGNIMVDAKSGEYIYNLYNDRDIVNELSEGEQVSETFSYTITDENGVTQVSTLTINITGTDDLPEFEVATVSSDVDNIDMTGLNFSSGFKFEADVKLDSNSETFFRQNDNGSNSFLIEFGDADHNSPHNPGTYLQLYIPLVNGGVYKAVTIDSLTIDEWHSIEVNYDPINGATIFIDGQSVGLDDSMGDSPSAMVAVNDSNYTVGSTTNEDFNGVFKDVKITSLEDDTEIVPNLSGDEVLFIQDDVDDGITDMSALLQNAITEGQLLSSGNSIDEIDLSSGDHILSNISVGDVLAMTDSDNTLKIETDSGDTVKLDLTNEWTATGNTDVDTGLDIYEGVTDSSVKLLIDSLNVEDTNI